MAYKLTYFDLKGRGEPIRLIFAAAGKKFADDRIKFDNWGTLKPTTPWGSLPILHVGDKTLGQSLTICRYLARKFKLIGANEWEAAKCDEYVDAMNDLYIEWIKFVFEKNEEKKAELRQTFMNTSAPKYLEKFEAIQNDNGGDFLVGKSMTWADIFIAGKLGAFEETVDPGILNAYSNLRNMKDAVFSNPAIKAYTEGA